MSFTPDAARNDPAPARFELFVQPAGPGVAVVATRSLSHELTYLGHKGQRRIDVFDGVELLLQFVWCEPQTGVAASLIIGHHVVVHEPGDAHATLGVSFLPAGEF